MLTGAFEVFPCMQSQVSTCEIPNTLVCQTHLVGSHASLHVQTAIPNKLIQTWHFFEHGSSIRGRSMMCEYEGSNFSKFKTTSSLNERLPGKLGPLVYALYSPFDILFSLSAFYYFNVKITSSVGRGLQTPLPPLPPPPRCTNEHLY